MDNDLIVNNCVVKEEVDLTLKEEEEDDDEDEEEEEEEEEVTNFFVNCDQNENNIENNPVEFINLDESTKKPFEDFVYDDPLPRYLKIGCQNKYCKFKCNDISQDDKLAIFQHFWYTLNLQEKMEFISCHICIISGSKRIRRNYFFKINEKLRKVCYKTFVETLDINRSWILCSLKHFNRQPNDTMSQFMTAAYKKFSDQGKITRLVSRNVESGNSFQLENIVLEKDKVQQIEKVQSRLIEVKNPDKVQSNDSKENNNEFETIILDSDKECASLNFKPKTPERIEVSNSSEIKENESGNIVESSANGPNLKNFKEPCGTCTACLLPQEQKKHVSQNLWKRKSYYGRIQYLANHIKIVEFQAEAYTFEFFLEFNSSESENVCEFGFQNTLCVCNEWLKTAMNKVMEAAKTVPQNGIIPNKTTKEYDKKLTYFWNKAKVLKDVFYTRTNDEIEGYNGTLLCDEQCKLVCNMKKSQWIQISKEFWSIETIEDLRKYILNHIQFFSLSNKPCRKYFLKIDNKLKEVCRRFFLETLSIRNELIELIGKENNSDLTNSIDIQSVSNESRIELPKEQRNCFLPRKMRSPCDIFYHYKCRQISEEERQKKFRYFWHLNDDTERYVYISKHVQIIADDIEGTYNLCYFMEINGVRERVCQNMFEATFDINDMWIKIGLNKLRLLPTDLEKKTINLTLKRSLTPDLILRNVKRIANSQTNSTKEVDAKADDPEIIDISNDSIDTLVEPKKEFPEIGNLRFELVTTREIKKDVEELEMQTDEVFTIKSEPIKMETRESLEMVLEEQLNSKERIEAMSEEEEEVVEVNSEGEKITRNKFEANSEELLETSKPIDRLSEEEIIEINSEDEGQMVSESRFEFQMKIKERRKFPLSRKLKGKFCNSKCQNKCHITNDRKDDIFNYFWNIGTRYHKFEFLSRHVDVVPVMISKSARKEIITMNLNFFLEISGERIMVCQETFLSVLGINIEWIHNVLNYFGRNLEDVSNHHKMRLNSLKQREIPTTTKVDSVVAFEAGLPYVTTKGTSLPGRKMRKGCKGCEFQCKEFSHRQREEIFHNFWNISNRRLKYDFLWQHIKKITFEDWKNIYNVREFYFEIDGKRKEVCPTMFTSTLDIDIVWVEKLDELRDTVTY